VLEGMASGKPVIATRVGGIVEIINDGVDGFLFNPGDSQALAEIVSSLLADGELREGVGAAARKATLAKWNIENRKADLQNLFRERVLAYRHSAVRPGNRA